MQHLQETSAVQWQPVQTRLRVLGLVRGFIAPLTTPRWTGLRHAHV